MIRRIIIRSEAKRDLREATAWYTGISPRLADDFGRRVEDAITYARDQPYSCSVVERRFRRVLVHRFPYALFFHATDDHIVVVAVLHQSRDPETLNSRHS